MWLENIFRNDTQGLTVTTSLCNVDINKFKWPNIPGGWLQDFLHIWMVLDSKMETGYTEWNFAWLSSVFWVNARAVGLINPQPFPHPLQFTTLTNHPTIQNQIVLATLDTPHINKLNVKHHFLFWVLCQYLFLLFPHISLGNRGCTVLK